MHPINKNISETGTFIHVFWFFKEVIYFWENVLKVCSINSNYFWNDTMYILIKCNMLSEFEKKQELYLPSFLIVQENKTTTKKHHGTKWEQNEDAENLWYLKYKFRHFLFNSLCIHKNYTLNPGNHIMYKTIKDKLDQSN